MPLTKEELRSLPMLNLLDVAVEEAAELILAAQKLKVYGPIGIAPNGTQYDNIAAVMHEARQVSDAMRHLGERHGVNWEQLGEQIEREAQQQLRDGVRPSRIEWDGQEHDDG